MKAGLGESKLRTYFQPRLSLDRFENAEGGSRAEAAGPTFFIFHFLRIVLNKPILSTECHIWPLQACEVHHALHTEYSPTVRLDSCMRYAVSRSS